MKHTLTIIQAGADPDPDSNGSYFVRVPLSQSPQFGREYVNPTTNTVWIILGRVFASGEKTHDQLLCMQRVRGSAEPYEGMILEVSNLE